MPLRRQPLTPPEKQELLERRPSHQAKAGAKRLAVFAPKRKQNKKRKSAEQSCKPAEGRFIESHKLEMNPYGAEDSSRLGHQDSSRLGHQDSSRLGHQDSSRLRHQDSSQLGHQDSSQLRWAPPHAERWAPPHAERRVPPHADASGFAPKRKQGVM